MFPGAEKNEQKVLLESMCLKALMGLLKAACDETPFQKQCLVARQKWHDAYKTNLTKQCMQTKGLIEIPDSKESEITLPEKVRLLIEAGSSESVFEELKKTFVVSGSVCSEVITQEARQSAQELDALQKMMEITQKTGVKELIDFHALQLSNAQKKYDKIMVQQKMVFDFAQISLCGYAEVISALCGVITDDKFQSSFSGSDCNAIFEILKYHGMIRL